jgi:hypothetical protein
VAELRYKVSEDYENIKSGFTKKEEVKVRESYLPLCLEFLASRLLLKYVHKIVIL